MSGKLLVILESPYAGDVKRNVAYAQACVRDSLLRGEAPLASHLLCTQDLATIRVVEPRRIYVRAVIEVDLEERSDSALNLLIDPSPVHVLHATSCPFVDQVILEE